MVPCHGRYRGIFRFSGSRILVGGDDELSKMSHRMNVELDDELFTGTIRTNPDDKGCREQFFDNRCGKITQPQPCGLRALNLRAANGNGAPAPPNSIDAIRKSFSSR